MNKNIKKSFNTTVFKDKKFTEENKQAVFEKIAKKEKSHLLPVLMSSLFIMIISVVGFYFVKEWLSNEEHQLATTDHQSTQQPLFELTKEETEAYEKFKINLESKALVDLEPISIAKLYVHADFHQEYEVQYALYTDKYVMWSEEEDRKIPLDHRGTPEQLIEMYKNIDQGTFVQTGEGEGYIEFYPQGEEGMMSGFSMVKNDDGVWQVAFMPMQ